MIQDYEAIFRQAIDKKASDIHIVVGVPHVLRLNGGLVRVGVEVTKEDVEEYVDRLGIEGTGRLLTYTEANAMTYTQRTNGAYYWLGSALDYDGVHGGSGWGSFIFSNTSRGGVRPVIVVNTSDIQSS